MEGRGLQEAGLEANWGGWDKREDGDEDDEGEEKSRSRLCVVEGWLIALIAHQLELCEYVREGQVPC